MKYMKSLLQKAHRGEGGFTLIELLVVIAILGVIAAVVILNVGGFIGTGKCEAFETEWHHVQTAAVACLVADNCTLSTTPVGPTDIGELSPYLHGELVYNWDIDIVDGDVTNADPNPCPAP